MQNVVWPTTIVQIESGMPLKLKNALRLIPVMIPGSASGRTNIRLTTSRPKKVSRWMAKAAHEPRISARTVAVSPACSESPSAARTSGSSHVEPKHDVAHRSPPSCAEIRGGFEQRFRDAFERRVDRDDHERKPDIREDDPHRGVRVADVRRW